MWNTPSEAWWETFQSWRASPIKRISYIFKLSEIVSNVAPLQLSSVNSFLESINDYLRLKDEELALNISALRVEGYEVEGINEEIDKVKRDRFPIEARYFVSM